MKIFIYDEFDPQDTAMLQALYSRSASSVVDHVDKVKKTGSGKFMERYYVGYGHNSIADCGSTTIFIEGVSMLVAKAIQDWPLYSGQETSSRYIDMSKQVLIDPVSSKESKDILDSWMSFYVDSQQSVIDHLKDKYPKKPDENEDIYDKAILARCFDIMRGFLPAGVTTQLSWHTNLRQAYDKLSLLKYHPLVEVSSLAKNILSGLKSKYPNSFGHKEYEDQENYRREIVESHSYFNEKDYPEDFSFNHNLDLETLAKYEDVLSTRPIKTNLPLFLADLGSLKFKFLLDFGSFRDIQRHRNGVCRMPLLTSDYGFNDWYLNQLPESVKERAMNLIGEQVDKIKKISANPIEVQYYLAMGFNVACQVTYGLPAAVYTTELRSGKTVHPTLRKIALKMDEAIKNNIPIVKMHSDLDLDDWDIRRGMHDIKEK